MNKKRTLLFIIPLLTIFLINRVFFFKPTFLDKTASRLISPVLRLSHTLTAPFKTYLKKQTTYKKLFAQHQLLKQKQEDLLQENIKLNALLHYTQKSKELRDFADRYKLENALLSKILIKNLTPEEHSFIVNKGSRDGVQKDMVAIYKFQLIGRVKQVFPTYSKITLITDNHSKVAAHTNTSNAKGIVEGNNAINQCKLRYISHLKSVQKGDLVLSSGQGLIFPEGFCLGEIFSIQTNDLCHNVSLKPLVDLQTIEMCHLTSQSKMNLF